MHISRALSLVKVLDSLNHRILHFFCHRIFYNARVKLSLSHCIALLVVTSYSPTVHMSRDIVVMDKDVEFVCNEQIRVEFK